MLKHHEQFAADYADKPQHHYNFNYLKLLRLTQLLLRITP